MGRAQVKYPVVQHTWIMTGQVMPGVSSPRRLVDLSVTALQKYVTYIAQRLSEEAVILKRAGYKVPNEVKSVCSALRRALHAAVPPHLADIVTTKLLGAINTYRRLHMPHSRVVIKELSSAVIHSAVTKLDCVHMDSCIALPFKPEIVKNVQSWHFSCSLVHKYEDKLIIQTISSMKNLQDLSINKNCSDDILISLPKVCPNLKSLSVFWSRAVSNKCINSLLSLKCLQHLNLMGTRISMSLLILLLKSSPVGQNLRSITCANLTSGDFNNLILACPVLVHIRLYEYERNVAVTAQPQLLKSLRVSYFNDIKDLLEAVGANLISLDISQAACLNIEPVLYYCPNLNYLSISGAVIHEDVLPEHSLRHIKNLTLKLWDGVAFAQLAVRQCPQVECISLQLMKTELPQLISLLEENDFKHLECLNVSPPLPRCTVQNLAERCKRLKRIQRVDTLGDKADVRTFLNYMKINHPGIALE